MDACPDLVGVSSVRSSGRSGRRSSVGVVGSLRAAAVAVFGALVGGAPSCCVHGALVACTTTC